MSLPTVKQLCLLHLFWCLGCWSAQAESYISPLSQWEDGTVLRQAPDAQTRGDLGRGAWSDEDEEQVQNVFKRFLFHYSKARNSVGAVQHKSHSVHPLLRLSPKLSQKKKKQLVLVKIRALPELL
ncbi:neuromedin-S [Myripristis murdjan]|uniref:neuromedin-S n=1 Tax=Myripristis murdjan TaxID=586833 RepID=UPI001175DB8B|nr:neuromedin-S [Myripristis murdjan]